jgi:hypothetical protein
MLESFGYVLLSLGFVAWFVLLLVALWCSWPASIIGGFVIGGMVLLLIKVLLERVHNAEDNHYSTKVEK